LVPGNKTVQIIIVLLKREVVIAIVAAQAV
jgi:hypothetical protein